MTIGLPRALLYHRYKYLWEAFFKSLGCGIIISKDTNKAILDNGIKFSIDECCLPSKIYMGHVLSLIGKCDFILVPRIHSYGKNEDVCVKFNAMYDIVKNTFPQASLLDYNIDAKAGQSEEKAFLALGKALDKGYFEAKAAYKKGKLAQSEYESEEREAQQKLLQAEERAKILIVSHNYITCDKLLGSVVSEHIIKEGGVPVFSGFCDKAGASNLSGELSKTLYWTHSKELVGGLLLLKDRVDGIILLSAFPCGPDSLVNDLITRKLKDIPLINIILDELCGDTGLQTRIESFMDIISYRKKII